MVYKVRFNIKSEGVKYCTTEKPYKSLWSLCLYFTYRNFELPTLEKSHIMRPRLYRTFSSVR